MKFIYFFIYLNLFNIKYSTAFQLNIRSMHFNLEKDSLWLSYPLKKTPENFKLINEKLPYSHKIAKCKVFEEDTLDYRLFFNLFEVKTPFFSGHRLEIVTIAKNKFNNEDSFVILDCYTNVMSWDPLEGILNANCNIKNKITNSIYNVNIIDNNNNNLFNLTSYKSKIFKSVLQKFSIFPNYICYFKNYPQGYKLDFNKNQIDKKVKLLKNVDLNHKIYLNYLNDLEHAFIYPQKMNFKVFLENV